MQKTLAIFSPGRNTYSETFIEAHRNLPFNIKFYYGGYLPSSLEPAADMLPASFVRRMQNRLLSGFSFEEKKLLFSLRKERVDCVLAEYGPTACESLKVVKHLKLPLLVHFHGYDASEKNTLAQYKEKYKELFAYAAGIIVVSNKMYAALLDLGCPPHKLVINCYGPAESFFNLQPDFSRRQFISVGRFVNKKAPHLTVFSFKKVVEKFPDARLVMAGDGELLPVCKSLVKFLHLENNVEFPGVVNPAEVQHLFKDSIAFVQHSIVADNGDAEGTPVAMLEAQAAGLPVISTVHGGIPDVVINNETGLLVNENDVEGMAANMLRVLREDNLASELGAAGRERIQEDFTLKKHLGVLQQEIENAMN